MSQRTDQRAPTNEDLDAYNKAEKLTVVTMRICKPKENKPNNHHIPKRHVKIGEMAIIDTIKIGALIMNANSKYVGERADINTRIRHYIKRLEMQDDALGLTFEVEHIANTLHKDIKFAESTLMDWTASIVEAREAIKSWSTSDARELRKLNGQVL